MEAAITPKYGNACSELLVVAYAISEAARFWGCISSNGAARDSCEARQYSDPKTDAPSPPRILFVSTVSLPSSETEVYGLLWEHVAYGFGQDAEESFWAYFKSTNAHLKSKSNTYHDDLAAYYTDIISAL
jgi:hypothetical protein